MWLIPVIAGALAMGGRSLMNGMMGMTSSVSYTDSFKGYGRSGLRTNIHSNTVAFQSEAVSTVPDGLEVGYVHGSFV
ncbi:hypothetical protein ACRPFF_11415, partial [Neisseria sp. SLRRB23]|uniref:hypothetical protein n=1 Tax=Neisseria sp. SLRRB23 TaxID=3435199 RepID=UPI003D7F4B4E